MALARKHRIVSDKDFDRAFRFGKIVSGRQAIIRFLPNSVGRLRFGVAVSAKKFSLAVLRNQIKRSVFSGILRHVKDFKSSYDVVIVPQIDLRGDVGGIEKLLGMVIKEIKTNS